MDAAADNLRTFLLDVAGTLLCLSTTVAAFAMLAMLGRFMNRHVVQPPDPADREQPRGFGVVTKDNDPQSPMR